MATISAYDSNSMSMLLSSLNTSTYTAGTNMLGINLADYATIKSGSYFQLMKAYYGNDEIMKKNASEVTGSTATSDDSAKTLANVESAADELTASAEALYKKNSDSVFNEVTKTDADGITTRGYDVDAIYEKVSAFVSDYNSLVSATEASNTDSITGGADSLASTTKMHADALKEIGITLDEDDNTLSINKDTFKAADMEKVKDLFQGNSSYAYSVGVKSSMLESYAKSESAKSNTYNNAGSYSYNFNSGSIFSDYI